MYTQEMLTQMEKDTRFQIAEINKRLKRLSKCKVQRLWKYKQNGGEYLQVVSESMGKLTRKRISPEDIEVVNHFTRKMLCERRNKLEKNNQLLKNVLSQIENDSLNNIIKAYSQNYPQLGLEYFLNIVNNFNSSCLEKDMTYLHKSNNSFRESDKKHMTNIGIFVRSKSEVIIVEKLAEYHICFEYEPELILGNEKVAPDFYIIRADGKVFIWEHIGLTNSPEYLNRQWHKIKTYIENGFTPWDNLILTFDGENGTIDLQDIIFKITHKLIC